jgi:uncharacterized coiled-coil protein SlyX
MNAQPPDDAGARIEALEIRIAHLENSLQQLSDALYLQQRELARVSERNRQLLAQLESQADPAGDAATRIEIPPHY